MYQDDPRVWHAMFELVAEEFAQLETKGLDFGSDGRVFPIIIGNKGDWSYLVPWFVVVLKRFHLGGLHCDGSKINVFFKNHEVKASKRKA